MKCVFFFTLPPCRKENMYHHIFASLEYFNERKFLSKDNAFKQLLYIIHCSTVGSSCPGSSLDSSFTEVFGMFTCAFGSRFCFRLPEVCLCPVPVRKPNAANCSADTPAFVLFRDIGPVYFCFPGPSLDFQKASYAPGA